MNITSVTVGPLEACTITTPDGTYTRKPQWRHNNGLAWWLFAPRHGYPTVVTIPDTIRALETARAEAAHPSRRPTLRLIEGGAA